ncbi:MAG: caspase family protein, partial [Alphaproteobacteria bacterium]|nr:caspase family protein [Alphaproteobacteria bacterium]
MAVFIDRKDRASDYAAIPDLPNALSDADVMARFLRSQGYDVRHHEDITKRGFEDVLRRALFDVDKDTEVVVFFAGHGFQIGSENYLVPVDADLDTVYDVPFEAVSLGSLVGIIGARARLQ